MNKAEAVAVLREVFSACPELGCADFVTLDPDNVIVNRSGFYKIRLRCNLGSSLRDCIKPILVAHKLKMTESEELITIYRSSD